MAQHATLRSIRCAASVSDEAFREVFNSISVTYLSSRAIVQPPFLSLKIYFGRTLNRSHECIISVLFPLAGVVFVLCSIINRSTLAVKG